MLLKLALGLLTGVTVVPFAAQNTQEDPLLAEIPGLIHLLGSAETAERAAAARLLGEIGAPAREAVPGLTKLLADADAEARRNAAFALGAMGPEAQPALEKLGALLKDGEWQVRRAAAEALGQLQDARAESYLKAARKDKHKSVREAVKRARKRIKTVKKSKGK